MLTPNQDIEIIVYNDLLQSDLTQVEDIVYREVLQGKDQASWDDRLQEFKQDVAIETVDTTIKAIVTHAGTVTKYRGIPVSPRYKHKYEEGMKYSIELVLYIHKEFLTDRYLKEALILKDKSFWEYKGKTYTTLYISETYHHYLVGLESYQAEKTSPKLENG